MVVDSVYKVIFGEGYRSGAPVGNIEFYNAL